MAAKNDTPDKTTAALPKWTMSTVERQAAVRKVVKATGALRELLTDLADASARHSIIGMVEMMTHQVAPDPDCIGITVDNIEAHLRSGKEKRRSATVLRLVPVSSK